jgi:hypothetical protein
MRHIGTVSPKDFGAVSGQPPRAGLCSSSARCTPQRLLSVEDVSEKDDQLVLHDQFGVELCSDLSKRPNMPLHRPAEAQLLLCDDQSAEY